MQAEPTGKFRSAVNPTALFVSLLSISNLDSSVKKFHHRNIMHRFIISSAFVIFFIVNPAFIAGCGQEEEPEFTFGEAEMLSLLGTVEDSPWSYDHNSEAYEIEFDLEQGESVQMTQRPPFSLVESAWACSNRSFVSSAAACVNVSHLGVSGTVTISELESGEAPIEVDIQGTMTVYGLHLDAAHLDLTHDGGHFTLVSNDGKGFKLSEALW